MNQTTQWSERLRVQRKIQKHTKENMQCQNFIGVEVACLIVKQSAETFAQFA